MNQLYSLDTQNTLDFYKRNYFYNIGDYPTYSHYYIVREQDSIFENLPDIQGNAVIPEELYELYDIRGGKTKKNYKKKKNNKKCKKYLKKCKEEKQKNIEENKVYYYFYNL
jgi:hypothetical protein